MYFVFLGLLISSCIEESNWSREIGTVNRAGTSTNAPTQAAMKSEVKNIDPKEESLAPDAGTDVTIDLEITYVSTRSVGPPGIYSVKLGCPDRNPPCIGDPQLLFGDILIDDLSQMSWSPSGDQVVFDSRPGPNLILSSADGSSLSSLTEQHPKGIFPAWSPDGSRISYTSCQEYPCSILNISLEDMTIEDLLSQSSAFGGIDPNWMPDSSSIVFNAYPNDTSEIMQIFMSKLDGSLLVQITDEIEGSYAPSISPDGKRITYVDAYTINSGQNLLIVDLEGNRKIITSNPDGTISDPAWSPIGGWIVYRRQSAEVASDLYLIKEDGSVYYQITETPDIREGAPAWRVIINN